jgi:hypothetical protein
MWIRRSVVGLGILTIALSAPLGFTKDKGKWKDKDKGRWSQSYGNRDYRYTYGNRDYRYYDYDRDRSYRTGEHIKYRGMDRNSDGVITRGEWRGNGNSFRRHDYNNDGVLSGREVRPGSRGRGNGRWKY